MQLCIGNGIYALPSLSSKVSVKPAEGDGFCFVYSALAATGQADSERAAQACLRRAGNHLHKFVRKDVDPESWAEDKGGMQVSIGCESPSCSPSACMDVFHAAFALSACQVTTHMSRKAFLSEICKYVCRSHAHDMLTKINDPQHHALHGVAHFLRPIKTMHVVISFGAHFAGLILPRALALSTTFNMVLHHASSRTHTKISDDMLQATVALKEQMMREEVEEGYLNQPGQEIIAYSEQACYFVLNTSTPTDELMALGLTTFGELLAAMQHFSVTIIGSVDYGKKCLLVRHKHADPAQEGLYPFEHFMPCMPATGVFHTFDTPTQVFINHLVETRVSSSLMLVYAFVSVFIHMCQCVLTLTLQVYAGTCCCMSYCMCT